MQTAPRSSTKTEENWNARKDSARRIKHAANSEIAHGTDYLATTRSIIHPI